MRKAAGWNLYRRFGFIDEIVEVGSFGEILGDTCRRRLKRTSSILIPHGTLISQMTSDEIEKIDTPIFGNKWILRWEADRDLKEKLMMESGLRTPKAVRSKNEIKSLCIVKLHGADQVGEDTTSHRTAKALKMERDGSLIKR